MTKELKLQYLHQIKIDKESIVAIKRVAEVKIKKGLFWWRNNFLIKDML